MLKIRPLVKGTDEPLWVEVLNAAYKEYEAWWRAVTVEEILLEEKRRNFDLEGRFIAEVDGKPVSIVHARVDKLREEEKSFIHTFSVIPEFRGRGVEEELAEAAIAEFRKRGMISAQACSHYKRQDRVRLLEKLDFKPVRRESDMEIDLATG